MNDLQGAFLPAAEVLPSLRQKPCVAMPLRLKVLRLGDGRWLGDTGRRIYVRDGQIVESQEEKEPSKPEPKSDPMYLLPRGPHPRRQTPFGPHPRTITRVSALPIIGK
jgi:hypothetical protein